MCVAQDPMSPSTFVFPRSLSVDLPFENGSILEQSEMCIQR